MENPIKMDDLGVPLFKETPIFWFSEMLFHDDVLQGVAEPPFRNVWEFSLCILI